MVSPTGQLGGAGERWGKEGLLAVGTLPGGWQPYSLLEKVESLILFICFQLKGDQDVGCGGDPLCPSVDAVPYLGGGQLLHGSSLPEQLVPPLL